MSDFRVGAEQATIFSTAAFCRLWSEVYGQKWLPLGAKNDLGVIYSQTTRLGLRKFELSPSGLYWGSNQENIELSGYFIETVNQISRQWNCLSLTWNFRYDAQATMEQALVRLGPSHCKVIESSTHVIDLNGREFNRVMQRQVKALTRRQIRIGTDSGLVIREIKNQSDLDQHASMYQEWVTSKGIKPKPARLIPTLAREMGSSTLFLGAFQQEKLMAVIFLFRDKSEWFYWYGIRDIHQDKYFATDVLLAYAIQKACESDVRFFNMGGSNRIKSLEFFKERWGAEKRTGWSLKWENPYWGTLLKFLKI